MLRSRRLYIVLLSLFAGLAQSSTITARASVPSLSSDSFSQREVLAYFSNGDLYVKDLPNGTPRCLSRAPGFRSLFWSPNGQWIAEYSHRDRELCVFRRDGKVMRRFPASSFSFDHNSDRIAWTGQIGENCENRLRITDLRTGSSQPVPGYADLNCEDISWSPNERWIAFTAPEHSHPANSYDATIGLYLLHADGKGPIRRLFRSKGPHQSPTVPVWSPNSRYLLLWGLIDNHAGNVNADGLPIYVCPVTGSRKAYQFLGHKRERNLHEMPSLLSFRPGDNRLAVSAGGDRFFVVDKRIYVCDPVYHSVYAITPAGKSAVFPAWSPDGKRLAFFSTPNAPSTGGETFQRAYEQMRLWVADADGNNTHRLESGTVNTEQAPVWIAGGQRLLFERAAAVYGGPNSL